MEDSVMCLTCGCGKPNDNHGDSRNITMDDLNQAAEAAGTTRDRVIQNFMQATGYRQETNQGSSASSSPANNQQQAGQFLPSDQPQERPGQYTPSLGQESGTAWQESQQMGYTGHGGVQKPANE
jgi:hypothetical protein